MKPLTLKQKAAISVARSRCNKCPIGINKCLSNNFTDVCFAQSVKAYIKGYNQHKNEIKENYLNILNELN